MERLNEQLETPVDLGAASVETQGAPGSRTEFGVIAEPLGLEAE
ncbi:benenodin family lasso peptide [Sphingomonas sp. PL-96]|nr:benenodin family lasso peptide [Sphingomonas sp. PL-96]MCC2977131.1 benenodin family lasso peptide [Sphingomonas sp. PL-96]